MKELEATAPLLDNKSANPVPVAAPDDPPLRKQSSDLAAIRTTNVSDYAYSQTLLLAVHIRATIVVVVHYVSEKFLPFSTDTV